MASKKFKRMCSINSEWLIEYTWLKYVPDDDTKLFCKVCSKSFTISHGGENDVKKHANGVKHKKYNTQISQNQMLSSFISSSRDTNVDKDIASIHSYNINNSLSLNVNC
jgi:hypothetical protein